MLKLIIELFVIYIVYKLIFEFIIPVYNTTKQVKRKINEMQHQMHQQEKNNFQQREEGPTNSKSTSVNDSDYIDYEEIKEFVFFASWI